MTREEFCRVGEALHGARWHGKLARDLGVGLTTVRNVAAGRYGTAQYRTRAPETFRAQLIQVLHDRATEFRKIAFELQEGAR